MTVTITIKWNRAAIIEAISLMMTQITEEEILLPGMISIADEPWTLRCNEFINSVSYCATRGDYKSTHWKETYAFELVLRHRTLVAIITSKPLSEKEYDKKRSERLLWIWIIYPWEVIYRIHKFSYLKRKS